MDEPFEDYYEILKIDKAASQKEVRAAYVAAAKIAHPDSVGSVEMFNAVKRAFDTLKDERLRDDYDMRMEEAEINGYLPFQSSHEELVDDDLDDLIDSDMVVVGSKRKDTGSHASRHGTSVPSSPRTARAQKVKSEVSATIPIPRNLNELSVFGVAPSRITSVLLAVGSVASIIFLLMIFHEGGLTVCLVGLIIMGLTVLRPQIASFLSWPSVILAVAAAVFYRELAIPAALMCVGVHSMKGYGFSRMAENHGIRWMKYTYDQSIESIQVISCKRISQTRTVVNGFDVPHNGANEGEKRYAVVNTNSLPAQPTMSDWVFIRGNDVVDMMPGWSRACGEAIGKGTSPRPPGGMIRAVLPPLGG